MSHRKVPKIRTKIYYHENTKNEKHKRISLAKNTKRKIRQD